MEYLEYLRAGNKPEAHKLAELLHQLSEAYYNGEGVVSDAEFDSLQDTLRAIAPASLELEAVGAPTRGKGIMHAVPMLSLQKCTTYDGFRKWLKDVETFVVRPKYDGIAMSLTYEDGKLVHAVTRGDGRIGEDVTDVLRRVHIGNDAATMQGKQEVRGELMLPLAGVPNKGSDVATHPRNLAAGVLARKGPDSPGDITAEDLVFVAYDIAGRKLDEDAKHTLLKQWGFEVGPYVVVTSSEASSEHGSGPNVWFPDREDWWFPADGVVCREHSGRITEATGHHPKHSIAWKFPSEFSTTTMVDVEWQTTRNGTVTPVAVFDTIKVDGSMISRATLHSYGRFLKLRLRKGSRIQVARRGGVIPHVECVVHEGQGRPFSAPRACQDCATELRDVEGGVDDEGNVARTLVCDNRNCPAQMRDRIRHWFVSMDADGFGPRTCQELARRIGQYLSPHRELWAVVEVYRMSWDDPSVRRSLGAANSIKLKQQVQSVAAYPGMVQLLTAMGIQGLGVSLARMLAERWDMEELFEISVDDLMALEGVGQTTAYRVLEELDSWAEPLADLVGEGFLVLPRKAVAAQQTEGPLSGEVICFTGTLEMPRKQAQELARKAGAKVSDSLIVGVTCVVMGADVIDGTSTKARKAYEMQRRLGNFKIWSEQDFLTKADR
jgi:DNA ligase (NAD+)